MNFKRTYQKMYYQFLKRHYYGITAKSRVLPDFLIIGAVRSGTTSLYYDICQHPSVKKAAYDEIGFFDDNYHLGEDWYRSLFPTKKKMREVKQNTGNAITGEDTPFYIWNEIACKRIAEVLPNVKLIAILRNPIDRAYSNYFLGVRHSNETKNFDHAIMKDIEFLDSKIKMEFKNSDYKKSYVAKGFYAKQLKKWFEHFEKKQIFITTTEELDNNPNIVLEQIFKFLELPNYSIKEIKRHKKSKYPKMNENVRKKLLNYFEPYNEELFELINQRFDW